MKKIILSVFLIICISLMTVSCSAQKSESAPKIEGRAEKAADFKLKDLRGNTVSLSSFLGRKAVLVDFSTTWCPYCISIIPELKNIYAGYKDKDLEVLAVYIRESKEDMDRFVKAKEIPYTVLIDSDGSVASEYEVVGVPTIIIVDKDGIIRYKGHGIPEAAIKEAIR